LLQLLEVFVPCPYWGFIPRPHVGLSTPGTPHLARLKKNFAICPMDSCTGSTATGHRGAMPPRHFRLAPPLDFTIQQLRFSSDNTKRITLLIEKVGAGISETLLTH